MAKFGFLNKNNKIAILLVGMLFTVMTGVVAYNFNEDSNRSKDIGKLKEEKVSREEIYKIVGDIKQDIRDQRRLLEDILKETKKGRKDR